MRLNGEERKGEIVGFAIERWPRDRAVARTKFERRKRRPGARCLQFFPEVYPRRDLSLFEASFEASFLHAQTKRNVPGKYKYLA